MTHSTRRRHSSRIVHRRNNVCPASVSRPAICTYSGIAPIKWHLSAKRHSPTCQANSRHYNPTRCNTNRKQPSLCARGLFPAIKWERLTAVALSSQARLLVTGIASQCIIVARRGVTCWRLAVGAQLPLCGRNAAICAAIGADCRSLGNHYCDGVQFEYCDAYDDYES